MSDVRKATNKILEMVEEGVLDKDMVIMSCLNYMSEDDVADMARINEFFLNEDEEEFEGRKVAVQGRFADSHVDDDLVAARDGVGVREFLGLVDAVIDPAKVKRRLS
jgi:hypothetical protein